MLPASRGAGPPPGSSTCRRRPGCSAHEVHGHTEKALKNFTDKTGRALPKQRRTLYLHTSEDSERTHKQRMAGICTLNTMEHVTMVSKDPVDVPVKNRLTGPGTNQCDFLGTFEKPAAEETWHVRQKSKASMYGPAITLSSGKVDGDPGADADPAARPGDHVPFTWHALPASVYEELIHSYGLQAIWHLTAADLVCPLVAIRQKKSYFGIGFTGDHVQQLTEELVNKVFEAMQCPQDPLFEPQLAELLGKTTADGGPEPSGKSKAAGAKASAAAKHSKPAGAKPAGPPAKAAKTAPPTAGLSAESLLARLQALDDGEPQEDV